MIPKFNVINSPAFAAVAIYLKEGQSVFSNYGTLNYMDGTINVSTKSNGIMSGIIRSLFTTSSFFQTYYTGTQPIQSIVTLSSYIPGDIIAMRIKPGEHFVVSQFGFLAASANIKVETSTRFKNMFYGESIFLNEIHVAKDSNEDGIVWIASYGGFDKIIVKSGETIKVDQGLFCFAKKEYNYEITAVGNIKSFLFSGTQFMMRFKGPCEIYVHSNNMHNWIAHLKKTIGKSKDMKTFKNNM